MALYSIALFPLYLYSMKCLPIYFFICFWQQAGKGSISTPIWKMKKQSSEKLCEHLKITNRWQCRNSNPSTSDPGPRDSFTTNSVSASVVPQSLMILLPPLYSPRSVWGSLEHRPSGLLPGKLPRQALLVPLFSASFRQLAGEVGSEVCGTWPSPIPHLHSQLTV